MPPAPELWLSMHTIYPWGGNALFQLFQNQRQTSSMHAWGLVPIRSNDWERRSTDTSAASCVHDDPVHRQRQPHRVCLGLYVDPAPSADRLFGEQSQMLADLTMLGQSMSVDVTVLVPGWKEHRLGFWYNPEARRWQNDVTSLPDVIFRRSGTFRSTSSTTVERDLRYFQAMGRLHTLPRVCSNKWHLYRTLLKDEILKPCLPATSLATSAVDVYQLVMDRSDVYVKPLAGAQGVSVYHCRRDDEEVVVGWQQRVVPRSVKHRARRFQPQTTLNQSRLAGCEQFQRFWTNTGLSRCIVQDTVALSTTDDGRPFDFRWLVQWVDEPMVVARVARVGTKHAVTTNIHTGGIPVEAQTLLESLKWEAADVIRGLDDVALRTARFLKHKYGRYAEVGIDLAVNPDGKIALFEVNPTPGRRMLRALSGNVREMSLRCLLEYAIRATVFTGKMR